MNLRGLCPDSNIDSYWVTDSEKGLFKMYGIFSSEISYKPELKSWKLNAFAKKENTVATSPTSFHSFLMGKSQWSVVNDTTGNFSEQLQSKSRPLIQYQYSVILLFQTEKIQIQFVLSEILLRQYNVKTCIYFYM